MNEKLITLVNGIEDVSEVELLCAFEVEEFESRYIIYTKNEKDDLGHTIIYAGKVVDDAGKQYLINIDEGKEWNKIKDLMREMAKYSMEETLSANTN